MYQIKIYDLKGNCLNMIHYNTYPKEYQLQTFWIESVKQFGPFVSLRVEKTKYINMGKVS